MAQESYPFDTQSVPEDAWTHMARYWQDYGVVGDPGSTVLQVTANSSGMQVFVAAGEAIVRGHHYRNTGAVTLAIAANGAGSSRIDRVVLRLNPSTNAATLVVVQGTAGAGVPSLTPNQTDTGLYDLPLAQVTVAAGAVTIAASAVADDRRFTGLRIVPCRAAADVASPRVGQFVYESTTGAVRVWTGAAWQAVFEPAPVGAMPIGATMEYFGTADPDAAWMILDGRALSRTTYATLYTRLGGASSPHGQGDGSTTFNIPDGRQRAIVQAGSAAGLTARTLGAKAGSEDSPVVSHGHGASSDDRNTDHLHNISIVAVGDHQHALGTSDVLTTGGGGSLRKGGTPQTDLSGGAGSHGHGVNQAGVDRDSAAHHSHGITVNAAGVSGAGANMPPHLVAHRIIKVL